MSAPVEWPSDLVPVDDLGAADFMEVVLFVNKWESEGCFKYTFDNYGPRFVVGGGNEKANTSMDALSELIDRVVGSDLDESLGAFWAREDAGELYDRALAAHDARRKAANKS